jgi:geranylgeranyl diphosphate synthase type II
LAKTETNQFSKLLSVFNDTAAKVCEGQQIDMNFETSNKVSQADYIEMITLKTAVLLGASLEIGARIANASHADAAHLYEFGKCIGIAFQIQDDILDSFGETAAVGKRIGGDIASNKKTLLLIELLDSVHKDDLKLLQNLLAEPNEETKIAGVLSLYQKYQIQAFAEAQKQQYLDTAFHHLQAVSVEAENKLVLIDTARELMSREN